MQLADYMAKELLLCTILKLNFQKFPDCQSQSFSPLNGEFSTRDAFHDNLKSMIRHFFLRTYLVPQIWLALLTFSSATLSNMLRVPTCFHIQTSINPGYAGFSCAEFSFQIILLIKTSF